MEKWLERMCLKLKKKKKKRKLVKTKQDIIGEQCILV